MKIRTALLGFLALSGGLASAASILVGNLEVQFTTSTNAISSSTPTINVGWIDTSTADLTTSSGVSGAFLSAGTFAGGYGGDSSYNGLWASTQLNFTDSTGLAGRNAFIFADFGNGDFSLIESNVQFLADSAIPNSNTLDVTAAGLSAFTIHAGTQSTGGALSGTTIQAIESVPEPAVALLGALGVLGLVRRRR